MRAVMLCLMFVLGMAGVAAAVDFSRESLAGVHLGDSVQAVKTRLGQPQKETKPQLGQATGQMESTLTYPHLVIGIGDGRVTSIDASAPSTYGTSKGVRIGDPASRATKVYGKLSQLDEKHFITLTFVVRDGRIVGIFLGPGPE